MAILISFELVSASGDLHLFGRGDGRTSLSLPFEKVEMDTYTSPLPYIHLLVHTHIHMWVGEWVHIPTPLNYVSWSCGRTHLFRNGSCHLHLSGQWRWARLSPYVLEKRRWTSTVPFL